MIPAEARKLAEEMKATIAYERYIHRNPVSDHRGPVEHIHKLCDSIEILAGALLAALDENAALAEKLKARDDRIEALEKVAHALRGMVK